MTPRTDTRHEEAEIRARIESWAAALRERDVERVLSHYAPDVVSYDLAPPLRHAGVETMRKGLEWWFPTFAGPIGYEIRDLRVAAGEDVAFAHGLAHMTGEKRTEGPMDVWVRVTVCLRKEGGAWKVVHEHSSVPFYMDGSVRAAVDLQP